MKFHRQEYMYKHQEKTMEDVDVARVQKVVSKHMSETRPIFPLLKDNGRIIIAFLSNNIYDAYSKELEKENNHGDAWIQYGEERTFSFSVDDVHHQIVVAEFWTKEKIGYHETQFIEAATDFHFQIKKQSGRETVWDVYRESELL